MFIIDFFKENFKIIIAYLVVILLLLVLIALNVYYVFEDDKKEVRSLDNDIELVSKTDDSNETIKEVRKLKVDIKGAVKKPGVYELEDGSIVNDVIKLAGGLNSKASTQYLNLSKKITDEMVINIYTTSEIREMNISNTDEECVCDDLNTIECDGSSIIIPKDDYSNKNSDEVLESTEEESSELVSINSATKEELMTLSGIGEAKADDIIEYRKKNGPFKKIEDLMNVSGIGEAIYNKIKDYIKL